MFYNFLILISIILMIINLFSSFSSLNIPNILNYYLSLNLTTIITLVFDKWQARKARWRVRELYLGVLFFLSGGVFSLATGLLIRHKNLKDWFWLVNITSFFVHVAIWLKLRDKTIIFIEDLINYATLKLKDLYSVITEFSNTTMM